LTVRGNMGKPLYKVVRVKCRNEARTELTRLAGKLQGRKGNDKPKHTADVIDVLLGHVPKCKSLRSALGIES